MFINKFARRMGSMELKGTWDASTNTPALSNGSGQKNGYYVVSTAGTTSLDGVADWGVGDWAFFDGTKWTKIDNSDQFSDSAVRTAMSSIGSDAEIHVAKNGSDSLGTGKPNAPFATVTKAVEWVQTENQFENKNVAIIIHPGVYSETVEITRPRVQLIGLQSSNSNVVQIGPVKINPSAQWGGSVYNTIFSMDRLLISGSDHAVQIYGSVACAVHLTNCYLYTSTEDKKCLYAYGTNESKSKIYINQVQFNNTQSADTAIDIAAADATIERCKVYSTGNPTINIDSSATLSMDASYVEGSGVQLVAIGATTATVTNSGFANGMSNSDGVVLVSGSTFVSIQNVFNIPSGTGFAVKGVAGSVFTHAHNSMLYGTNTKMSAAMTVVPMSTSFTTQ